MAKSKIDQAVAARKSAGTMPGTSFRSPAKTSAPSQSASTPVSKRTGSWAFTAEGKSMLKAYHSGGTVAGKTTRVGTPEMAQGIAGGPPTAEMYGAARKGAYAEPKKRRK